MSRETKFWCVGQNSIHMIEYSSTIKEMKCWYMLQMNEPWKLPAKWKKPDTKDHRLYDAIYMKCPE
jgi:hypothetical protein